MKATTSVKMAVLAVAVCGLVALPALAFAGPIHDVHDMGMDAATVQGLEGVHRITEEPELARVHVMEINPELIEGIAGSLDDGDGEVPDDEAEVFPDGGGEAVPSVDEFPEDTPPIGDAGDDSAAFRPTAETTPSITTTSTTVPRRPYLPYTGGNSLGWALAGVAVAALGIALAAYGAGSRRAREF